MKRLLPVALGTAFFALPLFPAFIVLTGVTVPGVSLVPPAITVVLIVAAAAIAAFFAVLLATTSGERVPTATAFAAFPAAGIVAAALGFDPRAGALFIAIAVFGVVAHAAIVRFFDQPNVEQTVFTCYVVSGALAALVAVLMVATKTPADLYTVGHGRAIGTFILPGELAGYLIMYVPFAYAVARIAPQRAMRALGWTGVSVGALAFILTFSRAGWVGMAATIGFFAYTQRSSARRRVAVTIVAVAVVAVGLVFNVHHDPSENFTRISIWGAAADMIARFPFSGVGPFDFAGIYQWVRLPDGEPTAFHAHSFLLSVAAELGVIGVVAVLFGWWRFIATLGERLRPGTGRQTMAYAIAAGLIGTWVQGLIDTVSLVIFAIWPLFTALALALARETNEDVPAGIAQAHAHGRRRMAIVIACVAALLVPCAFVQFASAAVFARAGAPGSLPSRLDPRAGIAMYETIEHVAPLPFVEATLAEAALRNGDLAGAAAHALRLPPGTLRDAELARIADARGDADAAMQLFLNAGDDRALQRHVDRLVRAGRLREAYDFEARIRDRLAELPTRANAAADSWWRLGRLAIRLGRAAEAQDDFAHADALAPLNTKYLLDAGTLALERHDAALASSLFAQAHRIDPGSAAAAAGLKRALAERAAR
jgi:putative inorganic carbon (HCO3(-)) transporter